MQLVNLLGKLKNIFRGNIHIHHLFSLNIVKVQIVTNSPPDAEPVTLLQPNVLNLNLDKISTLPPEQKEAIKTAVHEAVLIDDVPLFENRSKRLLEDIESIESHTEIKALLQFLKGKIPDEDYTALRSAIYIKNKFDARASQDEILRLKRELREKFGLRGLKISNLYSEGYFGSMIILIYNSLEQDGLTSDFLKFYNLIIDEEAFAVFVPSTMTSDQLKPIVHRKIESNLRYGIYFITIHGIGRECVHTIKEIMPDIESRYEIINRDISEKKFMIRAKFWFRKP